MTSLPNIKKPCSGCPFRKDTKKGWLGEQRMTELLSNDCFVCHNKPDKQCAGHMLIKGTENGFVRLALAFDMDTDLSGRELVFETEKECIEHHGDRT
jgi:hypothetical protein